MQPETGDINGKISSHLEWIDQACKIECDAIFFPELSLTGYEPVLAHEMGITSDDSLLIPFQQKSNSFNITIGIGAPTIEGDKRQISMLIFQPFKKQIVYSKQLLHEDELAYFVAGNKQERIGVKGVSIVLAICYESMQTSHFELAYLEPFDIYLSSVAKHEVGVSAAHKHFGSLALKHDVTVLMVNAVGNCDNFVAGGQSIAIQPNGKIKTLLDSEQEALLVYDHKVA
ncbi:MAG: carbon-nitrogen hydrolase family protein [Bacteroidetes bacterium]|nr:carbon-nitrogen hydrolase family protein [Bacteroidota bacterium]